MPRKGGAKFQGRAYSASFFAGGYDTVWFSDYRLLNVGGRQNILDAIAGKSTKIGDQLRVSFVVKDSFRNLLRVNSTQFLFHDLWDYHLQQAQGITGGVAVRFNDAVDSNPRLKREDRAGLGLRRAINQVATDDTAYGVIRVTKRGKSMGFEVDYNKLNREVLDDQGRPYMDYVLYGYGRERRGGGSPFGTQGRFRTARGEWRRPGDSAGDPRFFTIRTGRPPMTELSFRCYDFIEPVFRRAQKEYVQAAFWEYVDIVQRNFPKESAEYIEKAATFLAQGGSIQGGFGRPYTMGGQPFRRFAR